MNKELTTKLLSMYVNYERESLTDYFPTIWNNKTWCSASDGCQLILIPENEENKVEIPEHKIPNIAGIMPEFDKNISIDINSLILAYNNLPLVDAEIEEDCEACDGNGEFYYFGETYDCKSCNETGKIGTGKYHKIKDIDTLFEFNNSTLGILPIKKLLDVITIMECKELVIKHAGKVVFFELDNSVIIGIMIRIQTTDKKYPTIKIC